MAKLQIMNSFLPARHQRSHFQATCVYFARLVTKFHINTITKVLLSVQNSVSIQQIRFRSKINIQKPKPFHHERGKVMKLLTPFYPNPNKGKPLWEVCKKVQKHTERKLEGNPYEIIIAREVRNWFNSSKMVAFFHKNSVTAEDEFNFKVNLKRNNMYGKSYGKRIMQLALRDTIYESALELFGAPTAIVFSPDVNVAALNKAAKKSPQMTLLAGIIEGKLLSRNEFLEYGKMDLTSARVNLVSVLQQNVINLNRQLTHHQSTLVTRLQQIDDKND